MRLTGTGKQVTNRPNFWGVI